LTAAEAALTTGETLSPGLPLQSRRSAFPAQIHHRGSVGIRLASQQLAVKNVKAIGNGSLPLRIRPQINVQNEVVHHVLVVGDRDDRVSLRHSAQLAERVSRKRRGNVLKHIETNHDIEKIRRVWNRAARSEDDERRLERFDGNPRRLNAKYFIPLLLKPLEKQSPPGPDIGHQVDVAAPLDEFCRDIVPGMLLVRVVALVGREQVIVLDDLLAQQIALVVDVSAQVYTADAVGRSGP